MACPRHTLAQAKDAVLERGNITSGTEHAWLSRMHDCTHFLCVLFMSHLDAIAL